MAQKCSFCSEFIEKEKDNNAFFKLTNEKYFSRIIWEDDNFILTPTIGCFIEGYVILLSKRHIPNFGHLRKKEMSDLIKVVNEIRIKISKIYGSCLIFEHGSNICLSSGGGACIDHAHIHFVPIKVNLIPKIENSLKVIDYSNLSCLTNYAKNSIPYLMFSSQIEKIYVAEAYRIQSQLLRKIISKEMNIEQFWNWKQYPFIENMIKTYKRLIVEF